MNIFRTPERIEELATSYMLQHLDNASFSTKDKQAGIRIIKSDLRTLILFELGLKPMCIIDHLTYRCLEHANEPVVSGDAIIHDLKKDTWYIFKNKSVYDDFKRSVLETPKEFWKPTGYFLNYPPISVDMFHHLMLTEGTTTKEEGKLQIDFHGQRFISFRSVLKETLDWLEENFRIPEQHKTQFTIRSYASNNIYTISSKKDEQYVILLLTKLPKA